RPNRMNDVTCGQTVTPGDLCVAGVAAVQTAALREQLRTGRVVDRTVDASAAEQRGVCGIDDGIDLKGGDGGHHDLNLPAAMAEGLQDAAPSVATWTPSSAPGWRS